MTNFIEEFRNSKVWDRNIPELYLMAMLVSEAGPYVKISH